MLISIDLCYNKDQWLPLHPPICSRHPSLREAEAACAEIPDPSPTFKPPSEHSLFFPLAGLILCDEVRLKWPRPAASHLFSAADPLPPMKSDICPHGRSLPFLASCHQRGPRLPLGRHKPQKAFLILEPKCWLWADAAWYPSVGGTLSGPVTSMRAGPLPWGCLSWVCPGLALLAVKEVPTSLVLSLILMSHLTHKL